MPAFHPFTLSASHTTFLSWGSLLRQAASLRYWQESSQKYCELERKMGFVAISKVSLTSLPDQKCFFSSNLISIQIE